MSENKEITALTELDSSTAIDNARKEIVNQIAKAESKEDLDFLYQQFEIVTSKKNAVRVDQLNDLLDKVNNQAKERLEKRPDEIDNKTLIDYMNAFQNQIDRSQKNIDNVKDLKVQVNNQTNNININVEQDPLSGITRESKNKIASIISEILNDKSEDIIDVIDTNTQEGEIDDK